MPNNLVVVTDIEAAAQVALEELTPMLINIDTFSRQFSDARMTKGKELVVTQFTYPTVASKDFTGEAGGLYTDVDDLIENEVKVPLDKHLYKSHLVTQAERQLRGIKEGNIRMQARRVLNGMLGYMFGFFTAANFAEVEVIAPAAYDSDSVSVIGEKCDNLNWMEEDRRIIHNAAYYRALTRDPDAKQAFSIGTEQVIQQGVLPNIGGFDMLKYTPLPDLGENLGAIATHKNALAVATGVIDLAGSEGMVTEYATATDPETGFTVGVRRFTDQGSSKEYFVTEILAGAVVADDQQAVRVVSA